MNKTQRLATGVLTGLLFVLSGCGKQPAAVAPVDTPGTSAPSAPVDASIDLAALTQAVRRYGMERQKAPQNLGEVVTAGYLKSLPAAPPGKQFAIEPKRLEVILVNQ